MVRANGAAAPDLSGPSPAAERTPPRPIPVRPHVPRTSEGVLFLQRTAGNAAVARLIGTRLLQRAVYAEGSPDHRSGMDVGDSGPGVKLLQRLLGAKVTGVFDQQTRKAADEFQRQQGWAPSGVGQMTWERIDNHAGAPTRRPNLRKGYRGPGVALLQRILGVPETGYFGPATRTAVDAFQKRQGWVPSGVGPMTWERLDDLLRGGGTPKGGRPPGRGIWTAYARVSYDVWHGRAQRNRVWEFVGGSVGRDYENQDTCAARVSYALDYGGAAIGAGKGHFRNDPGQLYGGKAGDGMHYIVGAPALQEYLTKKWGPPEGRLRTNADATAFEATLLADEVAVFAGPHHAGLIKQGYSDPYVFTDEEVVPVVAWKLP